MWKDEAHEVRKKIFVDVSIVRSVPPLNKRPGMTDLVFGSPYTRVWYGLKPGGYEATHEGETVDVVFCANVQD